MWGAITAAACALSLSLSAAAWREEAQRATTPPVSVAPERGVLAVMRRDGLMIPFAAFKGTRWSSPWPDSTRAGRVSFR